MSVRRKLPLTLFMLIMLALAVGGCTLGSTPTAIPTPTSIAILPTDAPTLAPSRSRSAPRTRGTTSLSSANPHQ